MTITATVIPNGFRFTGSGFTVDVTSDQRWFTVYDTSGEPCGTIERPAVIGGSRHWSSYLPNGEPCTKTAVGPRSAFRSFIIAYTNR